MDALPSDSFLLLPEKEYQKCPYCKTGFLDSRVKRSFLYKNILFFVKVKRYKCSACNRKKYVSYTASSKTERSRVQN
jgi:DNA-directed RNA polymerase subunit RPC12/RpoP